uniref:ZP domain-containing protein n=1 Tax=Tetranychus urticae TaxID=32264 RepID=T1KMS9_TETUR
MNVKRFNQLFHCTLIVLLFKNGQCKEIDSKTDLQEEEANDPEIRSPAYLPKPKSSSNPSYYGKGESYDDESKDGPSSSPNHGPNQPRSNEGPWPLERPDVPLIKGIHVRCEKNSMSVKVDFDRPFYGVIFSKGHYNDPKCVHTPASTGRSEISFDLRLDACGMVGSDEAQGSRGSSKPWLFTESTIIIQHDPQVQEVWDQARRLRCTWYDFYEKTVSFKSLNVEMMDAVTTNFLGDNIQCWMQIQAGKGPFNSEATGLVKIGQTMTMVLAIKDDDGKFDMLVRNCVAHDGHHRPIQLVDEYGCITRPRIMSKFKKIKNFGYSASVASYSTWSMAMVNTLVLLWPMLVLYLVFWLPVNRLILMISIEPGLCLQQPLFIRKHWHLIHCILASEPEDQSTIQPTLVQQKLSELLLLVTFHLIFQQQPIKLKL